MGTNYYIRTTEGADYCEHCGRGEQYKEIHIGKSSMGWQFSFKRQLGMWVSYKEFKSI